MDALNVSNDTGTAGISHCDSLGMYLGPGGTKHAIDRTDGLGSHTDMLNGHRDMPCAEVNMDMAADTLEIVSICPIESKPLKSPTKGANGCTNEMDGSSHHPGMLNRHTHTISPADEAGTISMCTIESEQPNPLTMGEKWPANGTNSHGNQTDRSSAHKGSQDVANDAKTTENKARIIRMHQNEQKWPNSPTEAARGRPGKPNGCGNPTDMLHGWTDGYSIGNNTLMPRNKPQTVRTLQNESRRMC